MELYQSLIIKLKIIKSNYLLHKNLGLSIEELKKEKSSYRELFLYEDIYKPENIKSIVIEFNKLRSFLLEENNKYNNIELKRNIPSKIKETFTLKSLMNNNLFFSTNRIDINEIIKNKNLTEKELLICLYMKEILYIYIKNTILRENSIKILHLICFYIKKFSSKDTLCNKIMYKDKEDILRIIKFIINYKLIHGFNKEIIIRLNDIYTTIN